MDGCPLSFPWLGWYRLFYGKVCKVPVRVAFALHHYKATLCLAMLVAEELDFPWERVRVRPAPAGRAYVDPKMGIQLTGGSTSVKWVAWESQASHP